MDIISKKLANDRLYAYSKGRFWFWEAGQSVWKESRLMKQKYDLNHEVDKLLTPEDFLSDPMQFQVLEDYEVDFILKDALAHAEPGKPAPIAPASTLPDTPAATEVAEQFGNIPTTPSFDFSVLGDLSEQATEADRQFDLHYGTAQDEYLISCIYLAKVHELTAKAGRYGGGTWTKWYESKGLSKSGVWNMVKTGESFNGSTVEQLKQLPELTRKDLNLIARSGCADQLVENAGNSEKIQALLEQLHAAEARADTAKGQLDAATADVNGLYKENSRLNAEKEQALQRAAKAEEALKHQPITAVVDEEEVDRRATEKAWGLADARNAELQEDIEDLKQQLAKAKATPPADLIADKETADGCVINIEGVWSMALPAFSRLVGTGDTLNNVAERLITLCDRIHAQAVQLIIKNDKESQDE